MSKTLEELAVITYGKDYKNNPKGDASIPIIGTGGLMGYTTIPLNTGEAVLTGRKGSINNPIYIEGEFWNVDTIFCIKTKQGVNTKWLYYNLCNTDLSKLNEATGVPSVNTASLYRLEFQYFDTDTQTKIAHILTTIDNVIEKTEAAIAKYEAIKQGMMHDLFTRGIGADGQLRPSYADAPELYKESALGWIPKEWDCKQLDEYITFKMYGPRFSAKDYNKQGNVKTIRGMDFTKNGEILYDQAPIALLPNSLVKSHELQEGDVVVVTTADCGITAVFNDQGFPYIPSAYTVKYKFNEKMNPYFFKFQMETYAAMSQVEKYIRKGTLANLPGSDLLKFWMNIPKEEEQIKIVERLERVNSKIAIEKHTLSKQTQLKQGLMQDLLTGKVPVKVELINA